MLTAPWRTGTTTLVLLAAILGGSTLGALVSDAGAAVGDFVDPMIMLLVGCLFFTLSLDGLSTLRRAPRTVLLALGINFIAVPLVACVLTALVPNDALRLGVLIYCLAPCTDWFLGFTRLAGGDTRIGAALIPVQMVLQLALYPVWLGIFADGTVAPAPADVGDTLLTWFVLPAVAGLGLRLLLRAVAPKGWRGVVVATVDRAIALVIAAVIIGIFAANIATILTDVGAFAWVLLVVFLFFVVTFVVGESVTNLVGLPYPEHALLTMTTSARNAPLMLAVTAIALPDQPVVYAAIILGMLIEFPHLTALTHVLRRRAGRQYLDAAPAPAAAKT
ncbi:arsenic resistance protein [Solwaraspora sp. WMMB335]|uniref:arsenic resistance protein n=1 Tax=Solwaraspora sp. WMMB335 TaxID=3404118 RepID=UPI003B95E328